MMKEDKKTIKEIFVQKYPVKEVAHNPFVCAEAIGYLKALIENCPSEEKWEKQIMTWLLLIEFYNKL